MKRRLIALICLAAIAINLCGCSLVDRLLEYIPSVSSPDDAGPGRMVQQIDVALYPADLDFIWTYRSQDTMNGLLSLLRELENKDEPEEDPSLKGGQAYYAITVTYGSGAEQVYYLLGHRYLKIGDSPWCLLSPDQCTTFHQFLQDHPSEDPSHATYETIPPTTEAPTIPETTAPSETTA